jgi:NAD(P)H-binding
MPNAMTELVGMTEAVTSSELDWTIARITRPTDKPAKGTVRAGFLGRDKVGWSMSRADIARFLIDQLTDDAYHRALPAISN